MKNMRILVDTNIIVDYIANREPYAADAYKIIELCITKKIEACIAAHTVTNLFYILRKDLAVNERKLILKTLCRVFTIIGVDTAKIISALDNDEFNDIEDCLQDECAKEFMANYIITRNTKDFLNGNIKAIEPRIFLANYD